jgi:hypothetical protein
MGSPADGEVLAQRFRPYYKFSSDPGHGGEKVRPVSWEWFVSHSEFSQGGKTILTQAQLAADPTQILRAIGPNCDSDLRNAPLAAFSMKFSFCSPGTRSRRGLRMNGQPESP